MQQRDHRQLDLFGGHAHPHRGQLLHQACAVSGLQIDRLPQGQVAAALRILDLARNTSVVYASSEWAS